MGDSDRLQMSLDQVIKKDWKGKGNVERQGGSKGRQLRSSKGKGRGLVRGRFAKVKANGSVGGGKGQAKGGKKGQFRSRSTGKAAGRGGKNRTGRSSKGGARKGSVLGGKGGNRSDHDWRTPDASSGGSVSKRGPVLRNLWRGAMRRRGNVSFKTGSTRRYGKGAGFSQALRRTINGVQRVNRAGGIDKRRAMGAKGGRYSSKGGKGNRGYTKGQQGGKGFSGKGSSQNSKGMLALGWNGGYSKGGGKKGLASSYGYAKGKGGFGGGGSWQEWRHDLYDSWGNGKGAPSGRRNDTWTDDSRSALEQLSAEDRRMMKKITIVAQLDKVPKPHPAMLGMSNGRGRRSSGDSGSLSSRFAANFGR